MIMYLPVHMEYGGTEYRVNDLNPAIRGQFFLAWKHSQTLKGAWEATVHGDAVTNLHKLTVRYLP